MEKRKFMPDVNARRCKKPAKKQAAVAPPAHLLNADEPTFGRQQDSSSKPRTAPRCTDSDDMTQEQLQALSRVTFGSLVDSDDIKLIEHWGNGTSSRQPGNRHRLRKCVKIQEVDPWVVELWRKEFGGEFGNECGMRPEDVCVDVMFGI